LARRNRQNRYIIFVVIPRSKPAESSGTPDGLEYYYDHTAIFATEDENEAKAVAELLAKDYGDGPGEDYPEGFIFESEAEMSLSDRARAHDQLYNPEKWAIEIQTRAEEYVRKLRSLPSGSEGYCFRLSGSIWELRFNDEKGHFPGLKKGFSIIHTLLQDSSPDKPISAVQLAQIDEQLTKAEHSFQEILDPEAKHNLEKKLDDLNHLISEAEKRASSEQIERYEDEKAKIQTVLSQATGLHGKSRRLGPQTLEKNAQVSVRQAYKRALEEIRKGNMPKLAKYLYDHITTGHSCYCKHDPSFEWQLD
jgi:hypothetical protein